MKEEKRDSDQGRRVCDAERKRERESGRRQVEQGVPRVNWNSGVQIRERLGEETALLLLPNEATLDSAPPADNTPGLQGSVRNFFTHPPKHTSRHSTTPPLTPPGSQETTASCCCRPTQGDVSGVETFLTKNGTEQISMKLYRLPD